jgi:hypothetical protein
MGMGMDLGKAEIDQEARGRKGSDRCIGFLRVSTGPVRNPYQGAGGHTALQRTNTENSKQIFPEKYLRGHSPNFHILVSVSDLYIPTINLPILLQEICGPGNIYNKLLTDTRMMKLRLRPAQFPEKEYINGIFLAVCTNHGIPYPPCFPASMCKLLPAIQKEKERGKKGVQYNKIFCCRLI